MHGQQELSPLAAMPPACETLFRRVEQGVFDLTPEWFGLLAKTTLAEPRAASFRALVQSGEASAILPLTLPVTGKSRQVTGLTNFYSTLYRPILREGFQATDLAGLLQGVVRDTRASTLRFDAMDPEHPSFSLLEAALRQAGMRPFRFFGFGNWYLQAEGLDWETYLKQLPSKHRNTLKRLGRKFEEEVEGRFQIYTGKDSEIEEALAAYQAVYASSWKVPEPFPEFIPEFVRMSAQLGWLRMGVAYSGRQPVAAQFWLVLDGKASIYKVAYDDKFSAYSPGSLLTGQLMRHVLDTEHVREVDFLMGDDAYKRIWMSHRRERWGIVAYNPRTWLGLWLTAREALTRAVKPVIAQLREKLQKKSEEDKK